MKRVCEITYWTTIPSARNMVQHYRIGKLTGCRVFNVLGSASLTTESLVPPPSVSLSLSIHSGCRNRDGSIWRRWAARTNWACGLGFMTSQKWPSPIIISIPADRSVPSLCLPPRCTEPSSRLRAVSWRDGESFRSSRFISTPLDFTGTRC